ncbi:TonB-dependent receptor [Pararhizobium sp.]|uniref:TonB-dependent receptor n=1 Tax=Pararhizobium sp. TaxID=1977563 RepID=UPI00271DD145|nr:TonB-dependent receptor [Pararhizobium sp.]MDO9417772.1 TonB-dependent receptor [Pararhizobium sp.]
MRGTLLAGTALALLPLMALSPAHAQDQENAGNATALETLVVTATRSARPVSSIPGSVIVIEEADIAEQTKLSSDPATLISKLVPGFSVANQTMSGASETFRGRSVLVLVNGVPRNTPLRDVSRVLSLIDLSTVERIEVVNGASSLYGSGSTGGTINFITKKGVDTKPVITVETKARAFTENLGKSVGPEVSISAAQKVGNFDYFISATGEKVRRTYDGAGRELTSDGMLGQGGGDRTDFSNLYARLGYEDDTRRFEITGELVNLKQDPDWFSNYLANPAVPDFNAPYLGEPVTENSKYLSASFSDSAFALGALDVKAYYNDMEKRFPFTRYDNAVNNQVYYSGSMARPQADFAQGTLFSERAGLNATVATPLDELRDGMALTWGLDYVYDNTYQKLQNGWDIISPMTQNSVAAFAQLQIPVTDRFNVQAGARYERYFLNVADFRRPAIYSLGRVYPAIDVIGGDFIYDNLTLNLGSTFDITTELQAFGGYSQGFSLTDIGGFTRRAGANSSAELCDAYGALVCPGAGAPDFKVSYASIAPDPQVVNNYEIGVRGGWDDFGGSLSAFLSTSDKGVNYDVATNRVSQQKEKIWGAEATAWKRVTEAFTVGTVLSFREGRFDRDGNGSTESWLPNNRIATPFRGMVYGTYVFENEMSLRGEVVFFSGRDKIANVPEIKGTTLVNVLASRKVGAGDLSFGVENLFDTEYMNPTASATRNNIVNGAGRTLSLGYKVTF